LKNRSAISQDSLNRAFLVKKAKKFSAYDDYSNCRGILAREGDELGAEISIRGPLLKSLWTECMESN
jgi:hypothetical protein